MKIHERVVLQVSSSDPYWLSMTARCRTYEPEVESLLAEFVEDQITFVDCGANVGYWSIFAARNKGWRVLAVEAGHNTFGQLTQNIELNNVAVAAIHKAISVHSGTEVQFETVAGRHAGAHINEGPVDAKGVVERVITVSVDDLASEYGVSGLTILKLDVEGYEVQALRGARDVLQKPSMVIYEEHGSRHSCVPTRILLEEGFSVFFMNRSSLVRVLSVAEVVLRMRNRGTGYNLVASQCPVVIRRLSGLQHAQV